MSSYFVTGTDTNCGKTYVTCQLLNYFKAQNLPALALKPIASGLIEVNGQLQSEDVINLQKHNITPSMPINHWQFEEPISPHLAASLNQQRLCAQDIADFCLNEDFSKFKPLLIEGAGGLMVPLNEKETWLNFLNLIKIPVILIVGMRLGCINHALLTDAVLRTNNIETAGWIANCIDEHMLCLDENIETLSLRMSMPLLAILPHRGTVEATANLFTLFNRA